MVYFNEKEQHFRSQDSQIIVELLIADNDQKHCKNNARHYKTLQNAANIVKIAIVSQTVFFKCLKILLLQ